MHIHSKKWLLFVSCLTVCCCGCQRIDNSSLPESAAKAESDTVSETVLFTTEPYTESVLQSTTSEDITMTDIIETTESQTLLVPRSGVWLAEGEDENRYFFFADEENCGSYVSQSEGIGMGFDYEIQENGLLLHIGDTEDNSPVLLDWEDEDHVTFTWESGYSENLTYLGEQTAAEFQFYSDIQLCEMALDYYELQTGYRPGMVSSTVNEDGTVTIQLYDNLGDHNATSDWYTVDRYTAIGTNLLDEEIRLTDAE